MCMNCGCGQPTERHGKPANITADDLRAAAAANGQSLRESARHIVDAVDRLEPAGRSGGGGASPEDGLGQPAGRTPAQPAPRGTPGSES